MPALAVLDEITIEYGSMQLSSPLDGYLLFIPDFQVSGPDGWKTSIDQLRKLVRLVETRAEAGLFTFIGVENTNELPAPTLRTLLRHLEFQRLAGRPDVTDDYLDGLRMIDQRCLARWNDAREIDAEQG